MTACATSTTAFGYAEPTLGGRTAERYLALVHHVARQLAARIPMVELDDLISAGTLGLMRALENFDTSRGLAFSTYAVRRIRGAILDDLRNKDWVPRSVRAKGRKLAATVHSLEQRRGEAAAPKDVAEALDIDLETYWTWRNDASGGAAVSWEEPAPGTCREWSLHETYGDPDAVPADEGLVQDERIDAVREAIGQLPERQRMVLSLYYYEGLKAWEIAEVLQVSEARVSQIRSQAQGRLRDLLRNQ